MAISKTTTTNSTSYTVDSGKKQISGGNGVDTIDASTIQAVNSNGWKIAGGNGADVIKGSAFDDTVWGDSLGNVDDKANGADTVFGGGGNDSIHGGNGADILQGDDGADQLWGDRGGDTFVYQDVLDSDASLGGFNAARGDVINDFRSSEGDKLDLRGLYDELGGEGHPDKLTWSGTATDANPDNYGVWTDGVYVYADTTGDAVADVAIKVSGVGANDFVGLNHDPSVAAALSAATQEDAAALQVNLLGGASDSDGDTLSVANVAYATTIDGVAAVTPAGLSLTGGFLTVDTTNDAFDSLDAGQTMSIVVSYDVVDGHGGLVHQTATITVTGTEDAPEFFGSYAGTATEAGNLPGEIDPASASVTAAVPASGDANYSDVDFGDPNDVWNVDAHSTTYGSFTVNAAGKWTYTVDDTNAAVNALQAGGATLSDSFTITTADGTAKTISITIQGANDAPSTVDDDRSVSENGSVSADVVDNDTDPDDANDTLVIGRANTRSGPTATEGSGEVNGITIGDDGRTITFNPDHYTNPLTGVTGFDYLAAGQDATVLIDYNVVDPHGASSHETAPPYSTLTITVHGTNDAPTASAVVLGSSPEDASYTITDAALLAGTSDVDTPLAGRTITSVTVASGGGSVVSNGAGGWTYTPAVNYNGAVTFNYTVSDGMASANSTASLTLTAVPDAAVIGGVATGSVTEDAAVITVSGALTISDVDGAAEESFQASSQAGVYGSFVLGADGQWTYTLDNADPDTNGLSTGDVKSESFTVTAFDGTTSSVTVTVNGHSDGPTLAAEATSGDPNNNDGFQTGAVSYASISGTPSTLNQPNIVYGTTGSDVIDVQAKNDTVYAWQGNDTIDGGNGSDTIYAGSGDDTVIAGQGIDTVYGGDGRDTLTGNEDTDSLIGGFGKDILTGNQGADTFRFLSENDRGDTILDFNRMEGDKFDVSAIDANPSLGGDQAFAWGGTAATANGLWYSTDGTNTTVYGDTDGDASTAEFYFYVNGVTSVTQTDFVDIVVP